MGGSEGWRQGKSTYSEGRYSEGGERRAKGEGECGMGEERGREMWREGDEGRNEYLERG